MTSCYLFHAFRRLTTREKPLYDIKTDPQSAYSSIYLQGGFSKFRNGRYLLERSKRQTHHLSPTQSEFFPTSPKEIWEMEISNAREVAENNMYKLRMSQGCTQEA